MRVNVFGKKGDRPGTFNFQLSSNNSTLGRMPHQTFSHLHRVTYAECTIGNHIYYARYLDLLEAARGELFRAIGTTLQQLHERDTVFPVIEARLRYKAAARYDDVLRIEVWLTEMERVRLNFAYRILNEQNKLLVEASTSHACASATDKLKRLPEELAAKLQPYTAVSH
jgi:acyl-CoA thioester hydrolase